MGGAPRLVHPEAGREQHELGCDVDVERTVYGRESTGELVLLGEPDLLAREVAAVYHPEPKWGSGASVGLAEPRAIHEVVLDLDEMETYKQQYLVVRESGQWPRVLAVVELLSFANKKGGYASKYREKRSQFLASTVHFMEIDFLRAGKNPSRDLFPELPRTPYFIFVARKTEMGRSEEGYPLRLQDSLPVIGLPLGPGRPDLPLDLAAAFRSAYDLSYRPNWLCSYQDEDLPAPPLDESDRTWVTQVLQSWQPDAA
ncbi:MAG: DUF4058 family protein [Pirellulaceae bacterium]|nr:DUF4058 family protein [Pirellulaceae bacterium]